MTQVEIRDRAIWTNHIHGDPTLVKRLQALPAGATVTLVVDGLPGVWEKMRDTPGGRATPGLKPVGAVAAHWRELFQTRRGDLVELKAEGGQPSGWPAMSDAERQAAWEAFMALTKAGWRSEAVEESRDELHDR